MPPASLLQNKILILDFGSQYTQLIARRVREQRVYCEIHPCNLSLEQIQAFGPSGVILSGGPMGVNAQDAPTGDRGLLDLGVPILGICYGLQLIAKLESGEVSRSHRREYGRARLMVEDAARPVRGLFH